MIDFKTLEKSKKPNCWLVAPAALVRRATPDMAAPRLAAPPNEVLDKLLAHLEADPAASEITVDRETLRLSYVARILAFKDDVDIALIEGGKAQTDLAIYSRSRVGYSDFGVNRKRVNALIEKLRTEL